MYHITPSLSCTWILAGFLPEVSARAEWKWIVGVERHNITEENREVSPTTYQLIKVDIYVHKSKVMIHFCDCPSNPKRAVDLMTGLSEAGHDAISSMYAMCRTPLIRALLTCPLCRPHTPLFPPNRKTCHSSR